MWAFFSRRLRQWLVLAVLLPLASLLLGALRQLLERRSGETRLTRALGRLEVVGRRRSR